MGHSSISTTIDFLSPGYALGVLKETNTISLWLSTRIVLDELENISFPHYTVMLSYLWDELGSNIIDPFQDIIQGVPAFDSIEQITEKLVRPY